MDTKGKHTDQRPKAACGKLRSGSTVERFYVIFSFTWKKHSGELFFMKNIEAWSNEKLKKKKGSVFVC